MADVFLICPVRGVTADESAEIGAFVRRVEASGVSVYWPARDTDQDDIIGHRICADNLAAMQASRMVYVWWNENSRGSLFDLGMAFALGKPLALANRVTQTSDKSFNNVLRRLAPCV